MGELNKNIIIPNEEEKKNTKASERFIHVIFSYPECNKKIDTWVPIENRRANINLTSKVEIIDYLNKIYPELNPTNFEGWKEKQKQFWKIEKPQATATKAFFDALSSGGWKCRDCDLPINPNFARRIQDLKEFGYTISTDLNRYCPRCKQKLTHLTLLPLERFHNSGNGYETWSPQLRKRIVRVLNSFDVYENATSNHVLPDHKFSEIRWDENTKAENPDTMSDEEIRDKFQLMSNQHNEQKREVCRNCFQSGKRGVLFGIPFFYEGTEVWDEEIPTKGKAAEKGCVGCGWYDIKKWREELIKRLRTD